MQINIDVKDWTREQGWTSDGQESKEKRNQLLTM